MSKKRNAKTPRRGTGKKEQLSRVESIAQNDSQATINVTESSRIGIPITLFFVGALVALVAAISQYLNTAITANQRPTFSKASDSNVSSSRKTSLSELFHIACRKTKLVRCEKGVFDIQDDTRSIRTRSTKGEQKTLLGKGQLLLEIPANVQITTLDALRDPRVNNLLRQNPRHPNSEKPLHPKAFLAVYMAYELSQLETSDNNNHPDKLSPEAQLRRAYLSYLPSHEDLVQFHPISRTIADYRAHEGITESTDLLLPSASLTDHLIDQNFRYYLSEYQALCRVSLQFQSLVPLENWVTARLIVQSRSFEVDPLTESDISNDELDSYRPFLSEEGEANEIAGDEDTQATSLFYEKCRKVSMRSSMVPLLDAFDHHHSPNVGWRFTKSPSSLNAAKSFINFAMEDIHTDSDLSHSYFSWRPDPFVFAKYGFVMPYGSGERAALLAPYHRLLDEEFERDNGSNSSHGRNRDKDLHKYLAFRDGYQACDASAHGDSDEANQQVAFEAVKFEALKAISNNMESWAATLPPRDREGGGDLRHILSMCRLIAMTHRDYDGNATEILQTVADSDYPERYQFQLSSDEATSDGLEYRACHVLERLAREMRSKIVESLATLMPFNNLDNTVDSNQIGVELLRQQLEASDIDPSSWEGTSILVRLGELETLTILCDDAAQQKKELLLKKKWRIANGYTLNEDDYIVRLSPCH